MVFKTVKVVECSIFWFYNNYCTMHSEKLTQLFAIIKSKKKHLNTMFKCFEKILEFVFCSPTGSKLCKTE